MRNLSTKDYIVKVLKNDNLLSTNSYIQKIKIHLINTHSEILNWFNEDEKLKKQRRNTSLDIDKGYFEGCECTLAYVQSHIIRVLRSHGVRIPEQIN